MPNSKSGSQLRKLRRSLRGCPQLGAVSISKAAQLLDCPSRAVVEWIKIGRLLTVRVAGHPRVPLSEIRREQQRR